MARLLLLAALAAGVSADESAAVASSAQPLGSMPGAMAASSIDLAVAKASDKAKMAWAMTKRVQSQSEANVKVPPLVKAEIAAAKTAAETAAEEDKKMQELVTKSRKETKAAALEAAQAYYARVKAAGAQGAADAETARQAADDGMETRAGKAAVKAAFPYHAMLLRGQKVVTEYANNAQALAAASNNLKVEGASLATSAEQYQHAGEVVKAAQVMMTAHQLFKQGQAMQAEAKQLQASAQEVMAALPLYHQAEQAAASAAAAAANPAAVPFNGPLPY